MTPETMLVGETGMVSVDPIGVTMVTWDGLETTGVVETKLLAEME
jgi:hypothetical protein